MKIKDKKYVGNKYANVNQNNSSNIFLLTPGFLFPQTYDLQFVEELNNGSNFNVKIQIRGSSAFKLASSNITFNFNSLGLSDPTLIEAYSFNGINPGPPLTIYSTMTLTEPIAGVASIKYSIHTK